MKNKDLKQGRTRSLFNQQQQQHRRLKRRMIDTPPRNPNEGVHYSACPSPPRPNHNNFVNIPSSVGMPLLSSVRHRHPPPLLSLSRGPSTSTFSSLASDVSRSITPTSDDEEFPSSSSNEDGFFLAAPAATRPSFYYPVAVRYNNIANVVPQQVRHPVMRLQPRRSSFRECC